MDETAATGLEIAVIGMAGRFPGAGNIDRFWENLKKGVESITFYSEEELLKVGIEPELLANPDYVKCGGGVMDDTEYFDAAFFGYSPVEAEMMDPQMRIFHECAWHALEDAGYNPAVYDGLIGLFAGASFSIAWEALALFSGKIDDLGMLAGSLLFDRDFLCTRVSYRLNLKGPAVAVKTACSTSLVSIHMACQSILVGECDMALAGGITITILQKTGYLYREGKIFSPDGHCRAFDAVSKGTVDGDGVGIVVLKRLEDALEDRDHIYAVVKGSAMNNDGLRKAGYTAPSIEGQAEVIKMARQRAEVEPESIGYVETHGTGTELGDPVEIEGLKLAFNTDKKQFCPIGSAKSNVGHLDSAAGVTGFIKAVLTLRNKQIPPSINFEKPNPKIDFENSPFYVNTELTEWKQDNRFPRRAGVSSFGIGGTNAHAVLEEAPPRDREEDSASTREYKLLALSAGTEAALERVTGNLSGFLRENSEMSLEDIAYTLQVGRKAFEYKKYFVCSKSEEAVDFFESPENKEANTFFSKDSSKPVVFMFPGQGAQYVNMALEVYRSEPVFRREMDRCFDILKSQGLEIKDILYPHLSAPAGSSAAGPRLEDRSAALAQTEITQPVIFMVEYALAKLLMSWGIMPYAMIGHSIGEYTAACLSGVFSLEDALKVTALRGRLMQGVPPGAMLSVPLPQEELTPLMEPDISLAALNSSSHCVVSGTFAALDRFEARLKEMDRPCRRLHTSHAFHSAMMDPILKEFEESLRKVRLETPTIPFVSNKAGQWISTGEAVDPGYWAGHIRAAVNFRDGLSRLLQEKDALFIEVGPGNVLSTFLRQHKDKTADHFVTNLVKHPNEKTADEYYLLNKIGQLWLYGLDIDWQKFNAHEKRYRLSLPLYPFERRAFPFDVASVLNGLKTGQLYREGAGEQKGEKLPAAGEPAAEKKPLLHSRPNLTTPYVEPRGEMEKELANIWQRYLGFQTIGINDNFFELGGDSLNAGTINARVHRELGVKIPLAEIFNSPTIRELSQYIAGAAESSYAGIEVAEKKKYYPLSSAQRRLYILQKFEMEITAYNMPNILSIEGGLDKDRLAQTFKKLIDRHESLRTSFEMVDGVPVQEIHSPGEIEFEIEYVEGSAPPADKPLRGSTTNGEPQSLLSADTHTSDMSYTSNIVRQFIRPFDLSQAPLLRVGLVHTLSPGKEHGEQYILMIDMHHIISDGTSQNLLVRDFVSLYSGREPASLRLQYKDYAQWRQSPQVQKRLAEQEAFWLNEFAREAPVLNLPTDFIRPQVQSFAGSMARFELNSEETKQLKEIAHSRGATLFMTLSAIYNILLAKLSGQEDIVIGTAIAGRKHTDLERIVGMFVNTLALRNYPSGEKSFAVFLEDIKERTLKAFENDDYQLEDLLDKLVLKRDTGRNPLFDVMFILQNVQDASASAEIAPAPGEESLQIKPYSYEEEVAKFDLTLTAAERDEKLFFFMEYCTKLFKKQTIKRFIDYFKNVVSAVSTDPEIKLSGIQILAEAEKKQILFDFNDTEVPFPQDKTIHQLFADQVAKAPHHTVVTGPLLAAGSENERGTAAGERVSLTYEQLNREAENLSRLLTAKGVQPDTPVGLLLERSVELIVGILGILKAGAAYLPIDTEYPEERKRYMLRESSAALLLTSRGLITEVDRLAGLQVERILVDERGSGTQAPDAAFAGQVQAGGSSQPSTGLAYVIYTSGSTGKPKGVAISHRNVANFIKGMTGVIDFSPGKKLLAVTTICFDISVLEILLPLVEGLKFIIADEVEQRVPEQLARLIVKQGIDMLQFTPSRLNLLLSSDNDLDCLRGVSDVMVGGEAFPERLFRALQEKYKGKIYNMYGPTETTVWSGIKDLTTAERITIGSPVANTQVYILDKYGSVQPVGITGELYIGGEGLARGYLNRPELTAEKFITASAFGIQPQPAQSSPITLYHTGDLARWLPGGEIDFLGRIDNQVKIRGFRIELGEIENLLTAHDKIKTAVVAAHVSERKTPGGSVVEKEKYLCAYIEAEGKPDVSELRDYLSKQLPVYMVPSYFKQIEKMPLTPAGKVDLKALAAAGEALTTSVEYVPPGTELEIKVAAVWKDVLQLDKVGIDDNFFDLGGNSLDIIKVNTSLREISDKELSVVAMFKYSTIRSQANYFAQTGNEAEAPKIDRSQALQRGAKDRNRRRQMRRKIKK
ncbi:MAG: amino acid adenylation domain-containing protein [Candidatus Aminicenantes bacterium]|nr:amino acid adenylation domain-containing protein [Candidatus Aminicenantes bacterium]